MKKLFVFLAAVVGLSVISCTKEANITVDPQELSFTAQGGEQVLNVSGAEGGVTATSGDESWCQVSTVATRVTVTVVPNEGEESRTTNVTVTYRGTNVTVPVSQEGLSASSDIPSRVDVPFGGGTVTLGKVTANVDVKVTIPQQVTWIHDPAVAEDGTVTVEADANTQTEPREVVITVYPVGEVTLVQGVATHSIELGSITGDVVGDYMNVDITVKMLGEDATDYLFIVFEDGEITSTDDIMSALQSDGYNREVVDMYGRLGQEGEPDTLGLNLRIGRTFHAVGVALDQNGAQSALVQHTFTTEKDSPINIYNSWIGDWKIDVYNYDADLWGQSDAYLESRVAASDTISIVANNPGYTYWFMGWEGMRFGTDTPDVYGHIQMNAGFSLSDYSMSTMGGACEPPLQLSDGTQVVAMPILPAEYTWDASAQSYSVSFYFLSSTALLTTTTEYWGEGGTPENLNMTPVGITDSETQQLVIGDGLALVLVDASTIDNAQPTIAGFASGMSQQWLYPYTLTKIGDDPSMTPLSASMAVTRFYGRFDGVNGLSDQKFYVNSGISASNGPVKFLRMR